MSTQPDRPATLSRLEIHQRALRAAAAVASLGLACSSSAQTTVSGSSASLDASGEVAAGVSGDVVADAAVQADATPDGGTDVAANPGSDAPADGPLDAKASGDAGPAADTAGDVTSQGDVATAKPDCTQVRGQPTAPSCCELLAAWCEAAYPPGSTEAADCHWGPNFDGSTGCVPWGPPAPPAMDGAAVGLA